MTKDSFLYGVINELKMAGFQRISKNIPAAAFEFSICTIVTRMEEYALMQKSFEDAGFIGDCEYLVADNTTGNTFNAYEAIRNFLRQAQGKYIIVVHQDVRCIDNRSQLADCLLKLGHTDPAWAVCGNAGANGYHRYLLHINNNGKIIRHGGLPAKVNSLDENMLIVKKDAGLTLSSDLDGFHLYGTDLCMVANFLGHTCYVIPFLVKHLSLGNLRDLDQYVGKFTDSYGKKFPGGYIQTTCTKFYLSSSPSRNRMLNSGFIFSLIKTYERMKYGFSKLFGHRHPKKETLLEDIKTS